jgi:hypothetical protein
MSEDTAKLRTEIVAVLGRTGPRPVVALVAGIEGSSIGRVEGALKVLVGEGVVCKVFGPARPGKGKKRPVAWALELDVARLGLEVVPVGGEAYTRQAARGFNPEDLRGALRDRADAVCAGVGAKHQLRSVVEEDVFEGSVEERIRMELAERKAAAAM